MSRDKLQTSAPIATVCSTGSEQLTFAGKEFEGAVVLDFTAGETKYFSFYSTDANVGFGLQTRFFKSEIAGVRLEILWNPTSYSGGSDIDIFDENQLTDNTSTVEFKSEAIVNESGARSREIDFIPAGEGGFFTGTSGGQIGANNAFRIYQPLNGFIVKITNNHTGANTIKIGYAWFEDTADNLVLPE